MGAHLSNEELSTGIKFEGTAFANHGLSSTMMAHMTIESARTGIVESVNVGSIRIVEFDGQPVETCIWKTPVLGRVAVQGVNLVGDDQADRTVHGGPDKAVYAYAREDLDWWETQLDRPLESGTFGENLTVRNISVMHAVPGEQWRIGSVLLEVAQPRIPCYKLGLRMDDQHFLKKFTAAGRPGAYLRIVEEGNLAAGDTVQVVQKPAHGVTVSFMARVRQVDRTGIARLLDTPNIPEEWRQWAHEQIERHGDQ
ncbi:MAG: MOSC domain-containing protein [Chloroflexota bacterium]